MGGFYCAVFPPIPPKHDHKVATVTQKAASHSTNRLIFWRAEIDENTIWETVVDIAC
jgi:hypothetical protein